MKTSEIERVLQGTMDWQVFCASYEQEKIRLHSRKDGAATSGDLGLVFDSGTVVVTCAQIKRLCNAVLDGKLDLQDAQFVATVIALSGFDFDQDNTEEAVILISSPSSENLSEIQNAVQMLSCG